MILFFEGNSVENYKHFGGVITSEVDSRGRVKATFRIKIGNNYYTGPESHFVGGENKCELRSVPECENRKTNMKPDKCACITVPDSDDVEPTRVLCAQHQTCHTDAHHDICMDLKRCPEKDGFHSWADSMPIPSGEECICGYTEPDEKYKRGSRIICTEYAQRCVTPEGKAPSCKGGMLRECESDDDLKPCSRKFRVW